MFSLDVLCALCVCVYVCVVRVCMCVCVCVYVCVYTISKSYVSSHISKQSMTKPFIINYIKAFINKLQNVKLSREISIEAMGITNFYFI